MAGKVLEAAQGWLVNKRTVIEKVEELVGWQPGQVRMVMGQVMR